MNRTIYRFHTNSDRSFCIDGLGAFALMRLHELLKKKFNPEDKQKNPDFGFTRPAPVISKDVLVKSPTDDTNVIDPSLIEEGTRIVFCDCHPNPENVENDGSLILKGKDGELHKVPIEYVDHHDSVKKILEKVSKDKICTSIPDANMKHEELAEILQKSTGCSLAAVKLVDLMTKEYNKSLQSLSSVSEDNDTSSRVSSPKQSDEEKETRSKYDDVFSSMSNLAKMINKDTTSANEKFGFLRGNFTEQLVDVFRAISAIDLFSLGEVKESKELLNQTEFKGKLLEAGKRIIENLDDDVKQKYGITPETAMLNVIEQHVKNVGARFLLDKNDKIPSDNISLKEEDFKDLLRELGDVKISEELIKKLQEKYKIAEFADQLYHLLESTTLQDEERKKEKIAVIYMPFSPSSGCDKNVLKDLHFLLPEEHESFLKMTEGGTIREVELIINTIIEEMPANQKVLVIMEGKNNASLRANFPMMHNGERTLEEGYGFNSYGGHPHACGCARDDEFVVEVKGEVRKERDSLAVSGEIEQATSSVATKEPQDKKEVLVVGTS